MALLFLVVLQLLEIAIKSLNLKKGDEVIIPAFQLFQLHLCVVKLGLKPIFGRFRFKYMEHGY